MRVRRTGLRAAVTGVVLCGALLAGCGDQPQVSGGEYPSSGSSPTASAQPVDYEVAQILTATDAGGTVSPRAVQVADQDQADAFAAQFGSDSDLAAEVGGAADVAMVPDGSTLYAAVIALGCDRPTDVRVTRSGDGYRIVAAPVASSTPECLAPMTTVALVSIAD